MKEYTTIGYKDFFTKFYLIFTALIFLLFVNLFMFSLAGWGGQTMFWAYFWGTIVFGFVFFMMLRLVKKLRYKFSNEGINILLPSGKDYFIGKNDIDKVEKVEISSMLKKLWGSFGVKYNFFTGDLSFTTGNGNLIRIYTKDGKKILISPRKINDEIFNLYNK